MSKSPQPDLPDATQHEVPTLTPTQRARLWQEKNPERRKEYMVQYHIDNRDKLIAKSKKWVEDNPDRRKEYVKEWIAINYEKNKAYQRKYRIKLKIEVFEHYGGITCACCNVIGIQFLTIDHINGNGAEHRKEIGKNGGREFYHWLKNNGYPDGYQVLCWNCNSARGSYGYCHEIPQIVSTGL